MTELAGRRRSAAIACPPSARLARLSGNTLHLNRQRPAIIALGPHGLVVNALQSDPTDRALSVRAGKQWRDPFCKKGRPRREGPTKYRTSLRRCGRESAPPTGRASRPRRIIPTDSHPAPSGASRGRSSKTRGRCGTRCVGCRWSRPPFLGRRGRNRPADATVAKTVAAAVGRKGFRPPGRGAALSSPGPQSASLQRWRRPTAPCPECLWGRPRSRSHASKQTPDHIRRACAGGPRRKVPSNSAKAVLGKGLHAE